ncbi:DNA-binding protein [Cellvibrio sp. KY-GH-1]|uniref:single-stranded DNA-binding protein n=1 Tax=Cellvibrio sp. KY-GH-1 TaxID=2303332 RepID=UPI00124747F5|nr:single-stranded DNA-binding protein [Cellvibrio sp. KY-GH-1]QEY15132.1 DNA-binding protein [Cellvibrio sp. KY-GH-1]QEY15139.1 DNA-binding protein [Cellvibrio sp. KY-GH-1]
MSVVIEIASTQVQTRSGTSQKGKPYTINEQAAYMHIGQPYPVQIKINLENGQPPYQPGNYDLHPQSFSADRFGGISVRPLLVPRPAEQRQQPSVKAG